MKLAVVIPLLFFCTPGIAQQNVRNVQPFVEAGGGITTGITRYVYTKFIDPRIGIQYKLSKEVNVNANVGYVYFFRKENKKGISFLPLAAGISYNLVSKFFLEMQMGGALMLDGYNEVYFLAEPGAGWQFNPRHAIRISYYGFVTNSVAIGGINLSYRFTLASF